MKVLSLFDGMACGMLAMIGAGVKVDEYHAYEIDKYAMKVAQHNFPQIQQHGDVFEADFTQYNDFDFLVGGSPCVPAGTKIKTNNGYKNIEDVKEGDLVLTHKNRYRQVTKLMSRDTDELYHVKFNGSETVDLTGNHRMYIYRNGDFQWVAAKDLLLTDCVSVNINKESSNMQYSDIDLWLLGRYMADGYCEKNRNRICFAVGKNKMEEFENYIALSNYKYYICHADRPVVEYVINCEDFYKKCSIIGYGAHSKFIPKELLDLPTEKLLTFFKGYFSGDGHKRKNRNTVYMWSTVNQDMMLSLAEASVKLFKKYPIFTKKHEKNEIKMWSNGHTSKSNDSYNSQISIGNRTTKQHIVGDKLVIPIKEIKSEKINCTVYNISVEEDESYTVNNIIVHNCTYWSIAQKNNRETEASGLGWELFSQYVRALHEAKPKYFIYENNKSMSKEIRASIDKAFGFEAVLINSALVSAQNRQRLYWVGKLNEDGTYVKVDVKQPEDKGILLRDVLDSAVAWQDKSYAYTTRCNAAIPEDTISKHRHTMVAEPVSVRCRGREVQGETIGKYEARTDGKNGNLTANSVGCMIVESISIDGATNASLNVSPSGNGINESVITCYRKSGCVTTNKRESQKILESVRIGCMPSPDETLKNSQANRVYSTDGKSINLLGQGGGAGAKTGLYAVKLNESWVLTNSIDYKERHPVYKVRNGLITIKNKQYPIKLPDGFYIIRKLTVSECKRLQTVPEWYDFSVISNSQSYKCIGNGWTVDVITHLINSALNNK